jgi:phosphoglycolate phosphatase-like HAD superfamily hydrolase
MSRRPPHYRGVVFDLDGTLLDSMPLVQEGMALAVEPFRPRPDRTEVMGSLGGPSAACLLRLLGGRAHLAAALAAYRRFLAEHESSARLFRGARRLVREMHFAGIPLGIWTGRERRMTEVRLRALSLMDCFAIWICGDDLDSHKPDPEGLLRIVRHWGLPPAEVLFVGDSDQDLAGARAAGVPMVAIHQDRTSAPELLKHPIAVVATPPEAFAWIRTAVLGDKRRPASTAR